MVSTNLTISGVIIILLTLSSISGFVITMSLGTGDTGIVNSTFISGNRGWISTIPDLCLFGVGPTTNNITLINAYLLNNYPIGSKVYYDSYCKNLISGTLRHKYLLIGVSLLASSVLAIIMIVTCILIHQRICLKQEVAVTPTQSYLPLKDFSIQHTSDHIPSSSPPPYVQ